MDLDLFHLSCFLLGKGGKSMFASSIFDKTRPKLSDNSFSPLWYVKTGEPVGNYYKYQGALKREHTLSKVFVNPTSRVPPLVVEGRYFTLEGNLAEQALLKPFSGTILLKQTAAE